MPSQNPTSFASAAASNSNNDNGAPGKNGGGSGDWPRPRPNGATQTFRRSSQINTSSPKEASQQSGATPTTGVYLPPHLNSNYQPSYGRNSTTGDLRYSKEQLLDFYKSQEESIASDGHLQSALTEGWTPGASSGNSKGEWARRDEARDGQNNPDICWNFDGSVHPMGLIEMTDEEKEHFSSVNSPLKGPTQSTTKEGLPTPGLNGRKSSISQGQGGTNTGIQSRPGTRRRDTGESLSGNPLGTPTFARQSRDDAPLATPPSSLLRRRTDFKEGSSGSPFDKNRLDTGIDTSTGFGSWKRNASGPMSAGIAGPSSPWAPSGPQSAGFSTSFGNFSIENTGLISSNPSEKRLGHGSVRGESRFFGKGSSEDMSGRAKEKSYIGLEKLKESEAERQSTRPTSAKKISNLFGEDERIGSAALGGDEPSPPPNTYTGSSDQRRAHDEIGFSSLNAPSSLAHLRDPAGRKDFTSQGTPQGQHPGEPSLEPMSPTDTNPYQSPEAERLAEGENEEDSRRTPFSLTTQSSRPLTSAYDGDRSQTSSAGKQRPFPGLSGLGALGGAGGSGPWSAAPGSVGPQNRAGQGFASSIPESLFGSMDDISSPAAAFPTPTSNTFGSTSRNKLSALFSNQQQDSARGNEGRSEAAFINSRTAFTPISREPELPPTRGVLDELFGPTENRAPSSSMLASQFSTTESIQTGAIPFSTIETTQTTPLQIQSIAPGVSSATITSTPGSSSLFGRSPEPDPSANQPPPAQQRQMVMPDRMRWIYRDPSGATQGPFTGLEMHDWYKAGFFSPELQVKKVEDIEYEPLAQMIRRIGNSREPFLVPQIGIPHGDPNTPGLLGTTTPGQPTPGQPPFGNTFPSFGTTLTANQQNALEQRKQEEQYLMARQKEHLLTQHAYMRVNQMPTIPPMHPQQLHHHSSAHSLQSQPSFGNIASPASFQASATQGSMPPPAPNFGGYYGGAFAGQAHSSDVVANAREANLPSAMERLNMAGSGQGAFGGMPPPQEGYNPPQQVANMLQDRARLHAQQNQWESLQRDDGDDNADRLEQFHQLRAQQEENVRPPSGPIARPMNQEAIEKQQPANQAFLQQSSPQSQPEPEVFSQNQQVPKDLAPQPSASPLPAPAAQRNRQHIAEVLAAESSSRSQTPVDTPTAASIAPWAKESAEGPKGPSLREIQEAEARKASQREESAAAARRQAAEQERMAAAQASAQAPAPGLPSSASWAASSPVTATGGGVPWAKPVVAKATTTTTSTKKSLAQIQEEEEARKTKAAAITKANVAAPASAAGGKRYADSVNKVASPVSSANTSGGAWTTVGAGGKAKAPSSPAVATAPQRVTSTGSAPVSATAAKTKPAAPRAAVSTDSAKDEFQKWVKNSLGKGLNSGVNVDDFVRTLLALPPEPEILSEAVYGNSQTLDGHRFAEEFIRRQKQANKGIPPETIAGGNFLSGGGDNSKSSSGGWSEVAKKVPSNPRDEPNSPFKMVAAKKKGKR